VKSKILTAEGIGPKLRDLGFRYFGDELSRLLSVDVFEIIFFAKYGGFLSERLIRLIEKDKKFYLEITTVDNFQFIFPLKK